MEEPIAAEAEAYVRELVELWLAPHPHECLACYIDRAVSAFGCRSDLRFAARYRDLAAPRASALERRLEAAGGYCDCEALMNAFEPSRQLWSSDRAASRSPVAGRDGLQPFEDASLDDAYDDLLDDDDDDEDEAEPPRAMPPCTGVRRGSTQPCRNWETTQRPRWRPGRGWGW